MARALFREAYRSLAGPTRSTATIGTLPAGVATGLRVPPARGELHAAGDAGDRLGLDTCRICHPHQARGPLPRDEEIAGEPGPPVDALRLDPPAQLMERPPGFRLSRPRV